jgi:isopentenyl-diphosphate delta-isomerase
MEEYVILVDQNDNPIGKEEKVKCHLPNGKLHRAFSALIFNGEGKLLLTKRSESKMLWPNDWDGTVASHPRESETYVSSAERRMPEEIGIGCKVSYVNKFEYHVPYKDIGSENEICGTLIGTIDSFDNSRLIKDEISDIKWINPDELKNELEQNRDAYCPWMAIALYFLADSDSNTLEKFNSLITKWASDDLKRVYENAIKHYIPDNNWRLVQ